MFTEDEALRRLCLFRKCKTRQELRDWVYVFLNLDLPGEIVDQDSTTTPLDMVWDCYSHFLYGGANTEQSRVLYYAARDGGKTLSESVIEVLALLHLDINVVHLAAIEEQSRNAQRYLKKFFNFPDLRGFLRGDNVRETAVALYRPIDGSELVLNNSEYSSLTEDEQKSYEEIVNRAEVVVATMQSVNGKHAGLLCVDGATVLQEKNSANSKRRRKWTTARGVFRGLQNRNPGGRLGGEREEVIECSNDDAKILSLNLDTGVLEFTSIVRAQRSYQNTVEIFTPGGNKRSKLGSKMSRTRSGRREDGSRSIVCTPAHPFLVIGRGYVMAEELKVGDRLVVLGKSHTGVEFKFKKASRSIKMMIPEYSTDVWDQTVLGTLLGDGGLYRVDTSNPYMMENHCLEQEGYMDWKRSLLSTKLRTKRRRAVSGYTGKNLVGYYSANSKLLLPYMNVRINADGAERLGPLGLSIWYMDDGCAGNGFRISTEGFDYATNVKLTEILRQKFAIETQVSSYEKNEKKYYYISGGVEAKLRLANICKDYIHPDMAYKFDTDRNFGNCKFCKLQFLKLGRAGAVTCGQNLCQMIQDGRLSLEEVKELKPSGMRWVYDFTLTRNFNYISNGYVSHNCLDEIDVLSNPAAYQESVNIPTPIRRKDGSVIMPLTVLTSTRKSAFGLVQDEINRADKTGLVIKHFNLLDVTEACPKERHRPDLPKIPIYRNTEELRAVDEQTYGKMSFKEQEGFSKDEGYFGCLNNCRLFAACKGRLATHQLGDSKFLKPIAHTQNQFRVNSIEMAKAQLLCLKPSSEGLVYSRFDRMRHILSPAQAYFKIFGEEHPDPKNFTKVQFLELMRQREVEWYGGMDWGHTHNFSYVHAFKDGTRGFITHCVSMAELDPNQMMAVCDPFKPFDPHIYADTADPKMTVLFKKNGFRMIKWKKEKVVSGINIVRWKLSPPMGQPELFFIHDINEDPGMDILIQHIAEYRWKNDAAGKPTDIPSEDGNDEPDALRYMVTNVFMPKGKIAIVPVDQDNVEVHPVVQSGGFYDPQLWMQQLIAEKTGQPSPSPPERPGMRIEVPQGSYYGEQTKSKKEKAQDTPDVNGARRGRKGRLSWDL